VRSSSGKGELVQVSHQRGGGEKWLDCECIFKAETVNLLMDWIWGKEEERKKKNLRIMSRFWPE
jgi:hypothetical protein